MVSILTGNKFDPNKDIPDLNGKVRDREEGSRPKKLIAAHKVYIVTGGTAGIGFGIVCGESERTNHDRYGVNDAQTAHLLQHNPASIFLLSQKEEHADEAMEELKKYGDTDKVHWIHCDLKDLKQTDSAAKQLQGEKRIDAVGKPLTIPILEEPLMGGFS